ncbi:MAG TPA: SCO6880 family protein [Streptosporangiaceae bacterium]|nr:SCO6880 family protein [Streptosporangiaceae bacterium]
MSAQHQPRTYGGWRRGRGIGLFGLGTTATFLVLGVFIVLLVTAAISPAFLIWLAPPAVAGCGIGLVRRDGTPLAQTVIQRARWWWAVRRGYTRYRSEALVASAGMVQLPGVLAGLELLSAEDGYGTRYGLVRDRHTGCLTATLRVVPASTWLADRDDADGWIAGWGSWLAALGHVPMVRWVSVTVDTAPDPGASLADSVAAGIDPAAPQPARDIMLALAATAPATAADVDTRVSVTFDPSVSPAKPGTAADAAAEVGRALHGLQSQLGSCGVAVTGRCRAADIAGITRAAYDPALRGEVRRVLASASADDPRLSWSSAGPGGADELWDRYRHDSGVSVSWAWREAPRQNVHADVLARLTAPGPWPKRVTLQYRPLPASTATRVLESEVRAAEFRQEYARRTHRDATARDAFDHARAQHAAMEEAQGAGVALISLYVTVTAPSGDMLPHAIAATEAAAESSKVQLQRLYGSQSAAFTVGLPCGISLHDLSRRSLR